jgi:hypothetical protein
MLFIESRISQQSVAPKARGPLLDKLQEKGFTPLIRSTRRSCYELALLGPDHVVDLERAVEGDYESEDHVPFIRGEIFCFDDYVLFLTFGDSENRIAGMRAGIIYDVDAAQPLKKLDKFCRDVLSALDVSHVPVGPNGGDSVIATEWQARRPHPTPGFEKFMPASENDALLSIAVAGSASERKRVLDLLGNVDARRLLRQVTEAHSDARLGDLSVGGESEASAGLGRRLAEVGLLKKEVKISCRKTGRALFRLPSPDALSVITATAASCSDCGLNVADEKVDELLAPTEQSARLLENATWLASRIDSSLLALGMPEQHIRMKEAGDEGEAYLAVTAYDRRFLFALRDGDWTSANGRRAMTVAAGIEASHLIALATGKIHDEGRTSLYELARRRSRSGNDIQDVLVDNVDSAINEFQHALERVSRKALAEELCFLDSSLGLNVANLIAARFQLTKGGGALQELAASAAGAVSGRLRDI